MDQADPVRENSSGSAGVTRRDFMVAAAAGGALLQGCARESQRTGGGQGAALLGAESETDHDHGDETAVPYRAPKYRPTCCATISADKAVTSNDKGKVTVWLLKAPPALPEEDRNCSINLHGDKASYVAVGKSATGIPLVFSADFDGNVHVTEVGQAACRNLPPFTQHAAPKVEVWAIAVSPDGRRVLSATNGGQVYLWEVDAAGQPKVLKGPWNLPEPPIGGIAFLPGVNKFVSTHAHGFLLRFNMDNMAGDPVKPEEVYDSGEEDVINSVAVGEIDDGGGNKKVIAVTGGFDGRVIVWDPLAPPPAPAQVRPLYTHQKKVWRVALFGNKVASAGEGGEVQVYDVTTGMSLRKIPAEPGGVMGVSFTTTGDNVIYTTGYGSNVEIKLG
jgi:WD40 repeat protein